MKNIKYQKIIMVAVLGILIYPSMVMASWWNPFTWKIFNKALKVKTEQQIIISTPTSDNIKIDNSADTKEVKTPKVIEKKKIVVPTTISTTSTPQIISAPVIVPAQPQPIPTKNEIDELKKVIENLNEKVDNLEKKNDVVEERVNKIVKFTPEVTLDKRVIDNNGSDRVQVKIRTINDDGTIVPNTKIEVITSTGSDGGPKETKTGTVTSDNNGDATYNTPTTTVNDWCSVFMTIIVKINNLDVFGQSISVHNTQPVQSSKGTCS